MSEESGSRPRPPVTPLAELPREVLQGASGGYRASFTLAVEKAREKLRRFQLADPRCYILQLVQAVVASGANGLVIEHSHELVAELGVGTYRILLTFDGPGYTREELEMLYDFVFVSQADRARDRLRELALGLVSCQALQPRTLRVGSQNAEWSVQCEDGSSNLGKVSERAHSDRSFIEIRGGGKGSEVELVRQYCSLVPIPVQLNLEQVSGSARHAAAVCPWPNWRFERGDLKGWLGLPYGEMSRSSLGILRYGVQFARRLEHRLNPPVSVVFEDPRLRKNASQTDVVEDEGYFQCLQDLQQVLFDFALEFHRRHIPGYQRQSVRCFLLQLFEDWMSPEVLLSSATETTPELDRLLSVPVFTDRRGRSHPLKSVVSQYRRDGFLSICQRRYPYLQLGDWLVLQPGPEEMPLLESLFERVRWVDNEIHRIASGHAGRAIQSVVAPSVGNRALAERKVEREPYQFVLRIPNEYPGGSVEILWSREALGGWERQLQWLNGWSIQVEVQGPSTDAARLAAFAVQDGAADLYTHLLRKLLKTERTVQHRQSILRACEHLVAYWTSLFPSGWPGTREFSERVVSARHTLGPDIWEAQVFATRSGGLVSLNDMAAWLASFDSLTVAYGGKFFEGDHALDASPAVARFLGQVFGAERIQRVTLGAALLSLRQQQALLSGAAQHPEKLVKPVESSLEAEEDWEAIPREVLLAALHEGEQPGGESAEVAEGASLGPALADQAEAGESLGRGPAPAVEQAAPASGAPDGDSARDSTGFEADATPPAGPPAAAGAVRASAAATEPSAAPATAAGGESARSAARRPAGASAAAEEHQTVPAAEPAEPSVELPALEEEEEPLEPPVFSPVPEPVETAFAGLSRYCEHGFSQEGLAGRLWLPCAPADPEIQVSVCQGGHEQACLRLFDLTLAGWVVVADNRDLGVKDEVVHWTEEQAAILLGHLDSLYEELARCLEGQPTQSREFRRARVLLLEYLARFPERARNRLAEGRPDDPVIHLHFLPAAGGALAALATFYEETRQRGSLHVLQEFGLNPDLAYPVAVVGRTVSEEFYSSVLGVPTVHPFRQAEQPVEERLLCVLRRELRLLRERGDFRLNDDILAQIDWQPNSGHFVEHDPTSRVTGLDPQHRVVRGILKRFDQDRRMVPLLVSSVYTAINRALEEIRDEEEVAFLTALLEAYPDEKARQGRLAARRPDPASGA